MIRPIGVSPALVMLATVLLGPIIVGTLLVCIAGLPLLATAVGGIPEIVTDGSSESEDESRPRRSGWWSRRVLGKG